MAMPRPVQPHDTITVALSSGSTMTKIRDSCHSCAVSKVRCPKERPTCSRCEKRGIACEYFVTKRPGRKREKHRDASHSVGSSDRSCTEGSNVGEKQDTLPPAETSPPSPPLSTVADSAEFSSELSAELACFMNGFTDTTCSLDLLGLPNFSAINDQFTDFLTQPFDIEAELLNVGGSSIPQDHRDIADLLISDDSNIDLNRLNPSFGRTMPFDLCPSLSNNLAQSSSSESAGTQSELSTMCRCMGLTMSLLHKVFSPESVCGSSGNSVSGSSDGTVGSTLSTIAVLEQNKETTQAVSNMLQCSCTETGYMTTMLSIIVFKVLELYAMAVRQIHSGTSLEGMEISFGGVRSQTMATASIRQLCIDYSSLDDQATRRTTTQLILGELHHVQSIVNQLTLRRNALAARVALERPMDSPVSSGRRRADTFSAATLGHIEADLRRGLTALSSEIIARLRHS
ncbi:C6 transcription factor (AflR) [Pochonia chlamydosporia 170]|uniref:C6 transcription factor (AflR) n=1 Tax=Pochonia chlamydosporia 170 TaxID=1380566 RepID=A0A179F5V0_METCM|nr:C6 transcription factor (AflR) [Pochonia chlamydosporia 170]OAQ60740.1 C6 transcription factor (AflR) [Pochonia chlamydosporia 170]